MSTMLKYSQYCLCSLLSMISLYFPDAAIADPAGIDLAATALQDQGSPLRQRLLASDLDLQGSVGDRWNWRGNLATSQIFFHPDATSQPRIQQNQYLIGGAFNQYSDLLQGKISWQPLWIRIVGNDTLTLTQGQIGAMAWHFTPYNAPFDLTLDYTASRYTSGVTARQWHAQSEVFSSNRCNIFSIDLSSQQVTAGTLRRYLSGALGYRHILSHNGPGLPYSIGVSLLAGTQQYDVDSTLATVDNLPDIKRGSASATARWQLGDQFDLGVQLSDSRYQSFTSATRYETPSITVDLAHPW